MERMLIGETPQHIGESVRLAGWVHIRRDHGKLIFIDLRDRSGKIQMIIVPDHVEAYEAAKGVRNEFVIDIVGKVKSRPGGAQNEKISTGNVEIEVEQLKVLAVAENVLPVEPSSDTLDVNLKTLLDNRQLSLRNAKVNAIFRIYSSMLRAYDAVLSQDGFLEIKTPKILSSATEGGANFFKVKYFDRSAYLAQSPQFYKQAGVGAFERVFEIGTVFRAEPHFTTRHVNEYTGLDAEMGFIESFSDVMDELEKTMMFIFKTFQDECAEEMALHEAQMPSIVAIPRLKLTEALQILEQQYGKKMEDGVVDIDPEGERLIGEYVKKEYGSDLVFLTHYPTVARPFYVMPNEDPQFTDSFDLLFRGLEIASGGQRIHNYADLAKNIQLHGLNPDEFKHYLDNFRFGMPPHGGWGLGSERIVQKLLGLKSVKEAILFPRDVKRLTP
ncbi:MAG: aspartate--tRNA(Asn) ligase [Candidatus Moranbacteria bacterium]|nr:aspartate--tRNA(Asn) ligase [Candidatus Moranbacteria bacterium]